MIPENNLKDFRDMFNEGGRTESMFQGCKIIVEESVGEFDYEIEICDPVYYKWHTWHTDEGFKTRKEARRRRRSYCP